MMATTIEKHLAEQAPAFKRVDSRGRTVQLSDYRDKLNLVIVFNRGFG